MNAFRVRHLENFLSHYSSQNARPLDAALREYFVAHKRRVDATDRQWLTMHSHELVRWQGLLEHTTSKKESWSHKIATYFSRTGQWRKGAEDAKLPQHARLSVAENLLQKLEEQYGRVKAEKICKIYNENVDKIYLRVNLLKVPREALHKKLLAHKLAVEKSAYTDTGLVLGAITRLKEIPEFANGLFEIQDDSTQLKAAQVKALPGNIVFDLCAGRAGNALTYAAKMENLGHVFLQDRCFQQPQLKGQARRRLKAAGIRNFTLLTLDHPAKMALRLVQKCDWVLLDAPSTGTASYRKSPEQKMAFSEDTLRKFVDLQRELFKQTLAFVKPRTGKIVYATNSILVEENTNQVEYFCETHNLELETEPLFVLPQSHGMNGLFVAVLKPRT